MMNNKSRKTWQCLLFIIHHSSFIILTSGLAFADSSATQPAKLDALQIDAAHKRLIIQCEALNAQMPLEFFCVQVGGNEYESVLRTPAKPSDIHFGLLALGLTPGEPAHYVEATDTWYAPTGPPLNIVCRFIQNGTEVTVPAYRLLRSVKDKKECPAMNWVFDGSRILPDGRYAADITGYVVSIVNFDLTMIDVPQLASNSNETLEWEFNPDVCPKAGTPVEMIIEPAASPTTQPAATQSGKQFFPGPGLHGESAAPATQP